MKSALNLVAIGYAKRAFIPESREYTRMLGYARELASFHSIIFTHTKDGYSKDLHVENLHLYPTHSQFRVLMPLHALMCGFRILRRLRSERVVLSSQDPFESAFVAKIMSLFHRMPHHVQVHGDTFNDQSWKSASFGNKMRFLFGVYILKHSAAIRVVSERIRRSLIEQGISDSKITVLPIRPELEQFLTIAKEFSNPESCTFLSLGRLSPEKDIARIISAFALVLKQFPQVCLRIVGSGPEAELLSAHIAKLSLEPSVRMVPWTENASHEFAQADVFLLASKHEAYALTLVEALASGLPVVTTDVGCVGEVVKNGEHGYVIYEGTVEAYAEALLAILKNRSMWNTFRENGKETARMLANQSPEEYIAAWVQSFEKAL